MDNITRKEIFTAQVSNTRELETAIKIIRRSVHDGLRTGDAVHTSVQTKVLAQVFCAWAEANFLKVIHTPYGFELQEIIEVQRKWNQNGLAEGWEKAIQLGLRKVPAQKSGFVPNARLELSRAVTEYVRNPALIRNKIAHGQWATALNSKNNAVNYDVTTAMSTLTIIDVDRWHICHRHLSLILESLIESPERTFSRDFWPQLVSMKNFMQESQGWTIDARSTSLREKFQRHKHKP